MAIYRCYMDWEENRRGTVRTTIKVYKTGDDPDDPDVEPIDHMAIVLEGNDVNEAFELPAAQRNARLKELIEQANQGAIAKILVAEEAARNLNTTFTWPVDFTL